MTVETNTPHRIVWQRPDFYRTTIWKPVLRWPMLVILRATDGCWLGVGYVWHMQGYVAVRRHR